MRDDGHRPESSGQVAILLGNGDGTFASPLLLSVGDIPNQAATGDFNGDGILDLAVTLADVSVVAIAEVMVVLDALVTNTDIGALVNLQFQGNSGTTFAESNDCGTGLAAGASCTITTTFSPTKTGIINGTIGINYAGLTQTISMSGTGI